MERSLDLQIRQHVADYVAGRTSLRQFLDWFMDAADDAYETNDPRLVDLVDTIKLYWAEYTNGDLSEDALRVALRAVTETYHYPVTSDAFAGMLLLQTAPTGQTTVVQVLRFSVPSPLALAPVKLETDACSELDRHQPLAVVDQPQGDLTQQVPIKQ